MKMLTRFPSLLLLLALWLAAPATARAQDVITDLNGVELQGQVIEITPTQVLYRAAETDPTLPPTVLEKNTLFMVRFANGTKEVFASPAPAPGLPPLGADAAPSPAPGAGYRVGMSDGLSLSQLEQLRARGRQDALRYYNRTGPFLGTMFGTAATFGGIYPGIIIACIKPRAYKNKLLDPKMLAYPSYVEGYETAARKRKTWPVVGGYLSGLTLLVLILSAVSQP